MGMFTLFPSLQEKTHLKLSIELKELMNLKRSLQNRLRGWIHYEQNLFKDSDRGKNSRKKIGSRAL
jgi:hypothetical protein